jgi:DNA modification methylase
MGNTTIKEREMPQSGINIDLYLGDCAEVLKDFPDNSVDLIFTSPPYADQRKNIYGGISSDKYVGWFMPIYQSLYIDIIEPLSTNAKEKNEEFLKSYNNMLNKFTKEFIMDFCLEDGSIDWEKLVKFNSESKFLLYHA